MLVLTTAAFSQVSTANEPNSCLFVTKALFTSVVINSVTTYTLTIDYSNPTNGNKGLFTTIYCDNSPVTLPYSQSQCFQTTAQSGTITYTGISCLGGIGSLSADFISHTGNACGGNACGKIQTLPPGNGTTPVKLSSFSAVRSKQVVSLNWNTEFETDAKEFIVERAEGTDFRSVGTLPSNGNSSTKKSYSFNDKNENLGNTYYRLKNVDLNGKFTYSQIRTVKGYGVADDVTVFPNPARSNSKISLVGVAANSSIQLIDFSGKVLKNIKSTTVNSLDLSGVKNGTYLIRIVDKATSEIVNKKLTVTN